jgi:hypothetical protein
MKKITSILVFSCLFLLCCNKGDNNQDGDITLATIDIKNAKSLFIATTTDGAKLYGIKGVSTQASILQSTSSSDEQIFEIEYFDNNGEQIIKTDPMHIFNLSDFVVLCFGNGGSSSPKESYFVRKVDGKVFEIPREYQPWITIEEWYSMLFFTGMNKMQEDGNNNVYYITYNNETYDYKLCKVSLSSPTSLQFQEISAVNDRVRGFTVDKDGHVVYGKDGSTLRYRNSSGIFLNIPIYRDEDANSRIIAIWTGIDGVLYGVLRNSIPAEFSYYEFDDLVKIEGENLIVLRNMNVRFDDDNYIHGYVTNRVFFVRGQIIHVVYDQGGYLLNLSSETLYKEVACSVVANMSFGDNLYHFDKTTLSCSLIDMETGSVSLLYDLDDVSLARKYDIDKIIEVSDTGVVFSAVDLSDGKYVVAKIGLDNNIIIQQSIVGSVTTVAAIN